MLFLVNNVIHDDEINRLVKVLNLIDKDIIEVISETNTLPNSNCCHKYEHVEYLIGYGFVAIQRYISETLMFTEITKKNAPKVQLKFIEKHSLIEVINAGANYWKHSPEWVNQCDDFLSKNTRQILDDICDETDFPLSELLIMLGGADGLRLSGLIPQLLEWRDLVSSLKYQQPNNQEEKIYH